VLSSSQKSTPRRRVRACVPQAPLRRVPGGGCGGCGAFVVWGQQLACCAPVHPPRPGIMLTVHGARVLRSRGRSSRGSGLQLFGQRCVEPSSPCKPATVRGLCRVAAPLCRWSRAVRARNVETADRTVRSLSLMGPLLLAGWRATANGGRRRARACRGRTTCLVHHAQCSASASRAPHWGMADAHVLRHANSHVQVACGGTRAVALLRSRHVSRCAVWVVVPPPNPLARVYLTPPSKHASTTCPTAGGG
jgi:hypothetical protein